MTMPRDPFSKRGMKIALLATALLWLVAWLVIAWRAGVAPLWLALFALVIGAYGALGVLGLRAGRRRLRILAAGGAIAIAIMVALVTALDVPLLVGGLAVAGAAAMNGDGAEAEGTS